MSTLNLNSIYPEGVGTYLEYTAFDTKDLPTLQHLLTSKTIISIDGLAGVGKGTLGKKLCSILQLPHLHSGLLYRALTYIYEDQKLPLTEANTDRVINLIETKVQDQKIAIFYNNHYLQEKDLRNEIIDKKVNNYNNNLYVRAKIDEALVRIVLSLHEHPFVIDLRGANPPYIIQAEKEGFQVIRVLLIATLEEKVRRRFKEYISMAEAAGETFMSMYQSEKLYTDCYDAIVRRDTQDVQSILATHIGLVDPTSGIIDSTNLTIDQVLDTTLHFLYEKLA